MSDPPDEVPEDIENAVAGQTLSLSATGSLTSSGDAHFETVPAEQLRGADAAQEAPAQDVEQELALQRVKGGEQDLKLRQERAKQARQANRLRTRFFRWVSRLVTGVVVGSFVVMGLYIGSQWGCLDPKVMVAFFAAAIVQVIGLAYIVGKYLFTEPKDAASVLEPAKPKAKDP